jgi:hypothetical protein
MLTGTVDDLIVCDDQDSWRCVGSDIVVAYLDATALQVNELVIIEHQQLGPIGELTVGIVLAIEERPIGEYGEGHISEDVVLHYEVVIGGELEYGVVCVEVGPYHRVVLEDEPGLHVPSLQGDAVVAESEEEERLDRGDVEDRVSELGRVRLEIAEEEAIHSHA